MIKIEVTKENDHRPSRIDILMGIAQLVSYRGTCGRAQVGCVITSFDHRIICTGYNGTLVGAPHCNELNCDKNEKCKHSVHAEANAIAFAAKFGIGLNGASLYCTVAPCKSCAMLIVQSGIKNVIYLGDYTDSEGIELLEKNNVITNKHEQK